MNPIFSYFGSKWNLSKKLEKPKKDIVIEPFAGSASYSVFWEPEKAILIDMNPYVVMAWDFLIKSSKTDILNLPIDFDSVDELNICEEAKCFIGYKLNPGPDKPRRKKSSWAKKYGHLGNLWNEKSRSRIAKEIHKINNWKIKQGSYEECEDLNATWIIDPPYQASHGRHYMYNEIDYDHLSNWCIKRKGQIFVHESEGADWLPFKMIYKARSPYGNKKHFNEVICQWETD